MSKNEKIVSASPKVRKLAREFGADIYQIQGSQRKGRVSEDDVKSFIKKVISGKNDKKKTVAAQPLNTQILVKLKKKRFLELKKLQDHICKNLGAKFHMSHNMMKLILRKWKHLENL